MTDVEHAQEVAPCGECSVPQESSGDVGATIRGDTRPFAATSAIVERAITLAADFPSPEVLCAAKHCILDWCGVAIAGRTEPLAGMLVALASKEGSFPQANAVGHGRHFSARQAALVNGAIGHALDYDDSHPAARAHVTATVLPAALAAAEVSGASGDNLLRAFIAGYEATVMVAVFNGAAIYERGFHNTGVFGTIGAAVACGLLLGLDPDGLQRAVGIAATQSAALRGQFGTMCKPLHAGKASEIGLVSAQLAKLGFGSATDLIEGNLGFTHAHGGIFDAQACMAPAPRQAHIRECVFKVHAVCHGLHAIIEATHALMRVHRLAAADVAGIELHLAPLLDQVCTLRSPATGLEAKFSASFNAALAVYGWATGDPTIYTDALAAKPELQALERRVTIRTNRIGPALTASVEIRLRNGERYTATHDTNQPATDLAAQAAQLARKFFSLSTPTLGENVARRLFTIVDDFERYAVSDLTELLGQVGT